FGVLWGGAASSERAERRVPTAGPVRGERPDGPVSGPTVRVAEATEAFRVVVSARDPLGAPPGPRLADDAPLAGGLISRPELLDDDHGGLGQLAAARDGREGARHLPRPALPLLIDLPPDVASQQVGQVR